MLALRIAMIAGFVLLAAALLLESTSDAYAGALPYYGVLHGDWTLSLAFIAVPLLSFLYALLHTRTPARPVNPALPQ